MKAEPVNSSTLAVVNMEEATCAASYNSLLAGDATLAAQTWEALQRGQEQWDVVVGGRPLCSVLRPRFITQSRSTELARVSETIAAVMERLGERLLPSDTLLDRLGVTDQEREIWGADPGYPGFTVTSRLDSFMVGTQPHFIEYNAESPAAIAFCDVLTLIFKDLPAFRQWPPAAHLGVFDTRDRLLELLLWAYRSWGGSGSPTIGIIDWDDVLTRRDFELCAEFFREHGLPTVITDPRRLEYRQGKVWLGDQRIDLIYRRVLLHELLAKADEAKPLLQAYHDGAITMVNSPRSKLLHKKGAFALLTDGSVDLPMTEEERETIDRCIPWTRLVEPGSSTYGGHEIDLGQFMVEHRDRLTIKPNDDYGGKGVVLGWESSPDAWERAIERAMTEPHVVQERVPVPQGEFPVWQNGLSFEHLLVDTDPFLFRGEMGGILTRMSGDALLNVSAGTGSSSPTFVVQEGG
jgi:hypothetical protein